METKGIIVTSPVFKEGEMIPKKYSGQGDDINPPLEISNVPKETKSLALINDDPDAPVGNWIHWLVKDIKPDLTKIEENTIPGTEVNNSWGRKKYGGPMPPSGTHRYFFKVYALNVEKMKANNAKDFYKEVEQCKISEGSLMGKYKKT